MTKFFCALALLTLLSAPALAAPYAEFSTPVETDSTKHVGYRSSFFMGASFGMGAAFQHYNSGSYNWNLFYKDGSYVWDYLESGNSSIPQNSHKQDDEVSYHYSGFMTDVDFKLGICIRELVAVYSLMSLSTSSGSFSGKNKNVDYYGNENTVNYDGSAYTINIATGVGFALTPFRRKDMILHGTYVGFGCLFSVLYNNSSEKADYDIFTGNTTNFGLSVELGKEWQMSEHVYVGGSVKFNYWKSVDEFMTVDDDGCSIDDAYCLVGEEHNTATIQAMINFTRK